MLGLVLRFAPWLMKAAPLAGLIKGKAKLIGVVASAVFAIGTFLWIGHLNNKIDDLHADVISYQNRAEAAEEANATNQGTITSLRAANESLATAMFISEEERAKAFAAAIERDARAAVRLDNTLSEMEGLRNANPTCKELSEIDMGAVCPLVVEQLRKHAAGTTDQD